MNCKLVSTIFAVLLLVNGRAFAQITIHKEINSTSAGLQLSANIGLGSVAPFRRLQATIINRGPQIQFAPAVVHGGIAIPSLKITVRRGDRSFVVIDKNDLRAWTGRLEPLILVLDTGESYTFDMPLDGFVVEVIGGHDPTLEEFALPGDEICVTLNLDDDVYSFWRYGPNCDFLTCWEGSISASFKLQ